MEKIFLIIFSISILFFMFLILVMFRKEFFQDVPENLFQKYPENYIDTLVPNNLKYKCQSDPQKFKGTSLVRMDKIISNRHPIEIEVPWNWYSTQ